jgi:exo-beta-1,3-glucanase (GH17 family)
VLQRLLAVVAALVLTALFWHWQGRAVEIPGGLDPEHPLECVSYTPFRAHESPQDFRVVRERLAEDFSRFSGRVACIRVYSMEGMGLVPEVAREHGLSMIAGAWIGRDEENNTRELEALVAMARAHPDVVRAVLVGNEVLLRRERTAAQMLAYLGRVKSEVEQPVSYGDVWEFWLQNPSIAGGVDFLTIHLLPYWENDPTPVDRAVEAVAHARAETAAAFPGKPIFIGETGWPSEGRRREGAQPGRIEAARFLRGFVSRATQEGWHYNLIEAFDQPWKRAQEGAVGGYWGLFDAARQDKGILSGRVSDLPRWRECLLVSATLGLLLVLAASRRSPAVVLVAFAGGSATVFHLHQMLLYSRGMAESLWFILLALCSVAATVLLGRHAPVRGRMRDAVLLLALVLAATEMLGLAVDARYRHFPVAVFLLPAVAVWVLRVGDPFMRARARVMAFLLLACVPWVLWQETLLNTQALLWCGVAALMGVGALRETPQAAEPREGSRTQASSASTAAGAP